MTYRAPLIVNAGAAQIQELAVADGLSVAGNVLVTNILASNYLYANGQPFNGNSGGSFIADGASNVTVNGPNGLVTTSVSGVGNIVMVNPTGQYVTGVAYASSFMQAPYFTGNIIAGNITATGNILAGNITATGNVLTGNVTATGNVVTGNVTATGNVTGNFILGNGAFLSGVITSVANINNGGSNVAVSSANANVTISVSTVANVVTITPTTVIVTSSAGNVVSTTGNVSAGFYYGNGSLLTGVSSSSNTIFNGSSNVVIGAANANVTISVSTVANVVVITPTQVSVAGNIIAGNISASGNINANAAPGSTRTFAVGYMTIPVNNTVSAYTLALADQGELIYNSGNSITVTVPSNANVAFPIGSVVAFAQYSTGTMTIAAQAGVTLALVGTSLSGNRTLTATGMASCTQVATNIWLVTGTGLT